MRIAVGSDHAGWEVKQRVIECLQNHQMEVKDFGAYGLDSVDYPDFATPVATAVASGAYPFGILICYTGIGMSIAANKVKGIRAALVNSVENARLTREHNDANILCLSAKDVHWDQMADIIQTFLTTSFVHGRHERRVEKVMALEDFHEEG